MGDKINCERTSSPVSKAGVTLWGNEGNDLLQGGQDNDFIHGGAGSDTLDGGLGEDTLYSADGVAFNDYLSGDEGQDKGYVDDDGAGHFGDHLYFYVNPDGDPNDPPRLDVELIYIVSNP